VRTWRQLGADVRASRATLFELGHPNRRSLDIVLFLHFLESAAQLTLIGFCLTVGMSLPYLPLVALMIGYALWNVGSFVWTRRGDESRDCTLALSVQLVIEVIVLAALLYFGGGATNPFVSLFLVPVAMGAITLPTKSALLIAMLAAVCYTLLLAFFEPLPGGQHHMHEASAFSAHVIGMWVNFLVSGALLFGFLARLSAVARERAEDISALRESRLRDERLVAMAGVAAGAAHSLATPLSTIGLALDELLDTAPEADREIARVAREQLGVCRERLDEILQTTRAGHAGAMNGLLSDLIPAHVRQWHLLRPETDLRTVLDLPSVSVTIDPAIGHGLSTLLDNAIDAGISNNDLFVELRARVDGSLLIIDVEDHGGGPPPRIGQAPVPSTKRNGAGAGLMILGANLDRLGGSLVAKAGDQGSVMTMTVPLEEVVQP